MKRFKLSRQEKLLFATPLLLLVLVPAWLLVKADSLDRTLHEPAGPQTIDCGLATSRSVMNDPCAIAEFKAGKPFRVRHSITPRWVPTHNSMPTSFQLVSREVFVPAPAGACVMAGSFYTRRHGLELGSLHWHLLRPDTVDVAFSRHSQDNGRTWSAPQQITTREERENGVLRRFVYPGYLDPHSGRLVFVWAEGVLPDDHPKHSMKQSYPRYLVSNDGGKSFVIDEQIICDGVEYSSSHPLPGHYIGKNATQVAATTCIPLALADGTILAPCQMSPIGPDGEYFNPGGGATYTEPLVLRGVWQSDLRLKWDASERVRADPNLTTRGLIEPTLAVLEDGRVLMVLRGSNDVKPQLPGTKWFAFSDDGARTWSAPQRWTYEDGETFFSPSSCSQLLLHGNGKVLWLGNISPQNPKGNAPRYPLVIGEVNRKTGLLIRESVFVIDDKSEDDHDTMNLSNFYAREDRETGEIVLHCTRLYANNKDGQPRDRTADALIYRMAIA